MREGRYWGYCASFRIAFKFRVIEGTIGDVSRFSILRETLEAAGINALDLGALY